MPVWHDKEKLNTLLKENGVPLNDVVKRGEFYKSYFDWNLYSDYYKQGKSIRDICKITGLSYDVVRSNLLRTLGSLRDFSVKGLNKYSFNNDLIFPISNIGAYFLGWLYSDGCVTYNKITITLKSNDYLHLKYLLGNFTAKPVIINNKGFAHFDYYSVSLVSKLMNEYNLKPRKSYSNYKIPLNKFNDKIPYLLLGLFDGDGSIAMNNIGAQLLLPSNTFNSLSCYLEDNNILPKYTKLLNRYGLVSLNYSGENYFNFLDFMYTNTTSVIPLIRKFNNYVCQLDRSALGKTSPYKKLAVKKRDSLTNRIKQVREYENIRV